MILQRLNTLSARAAPDADYRQTHTKAGWCQKEISFEEARKGLALRCATVLQPASLQRLPVATQCRRKQAMERDSGIPTPRDVMRAPLQIQRNKNKSTWALRSVRRDGH
ncbi:hypothetical protein SKAU_G00370750 [Synaphobranchus kaupii]|uniref:Uncharacterized protein n=1 Tax=Synaphobranchus kaupii TaxID=118154 RepID=A0A9Q1EFZ1_SYNKA|nr:hypothetical protein SKAU_G00370750 [Synaphobranchus kaupii]